MSGAGERDPGAARQCYVDFYEALVARDTAALEDLLADNFELEHMSGMRQGKKAFIQAVVDGTLRYDAVRHESILPRLSGPSPCLTGQSVVTAAVFGGSTHTWHLRLQMQLVPDRQRWRIGPTAASPY